MSPNRQIKTRKLPQRQEGFALVSALLALVVMGFITAATIIGQQTDSQRTAGSLQGQVLMEIATGVNQYVMENYPSLQNDTAVTVNAVTLATGAAEGETMAPTIANLIAMNYLRTGITNQAQLGGGQYRIILQKTPAACVGTACNITGVLYINQALVRPGTTEMAPLQIGAIMNRVGSDVAVALNTNPAVMVSPSGTTFDNPISATSAGVVGVRVGFGSGAFGKYLIVRDPRDPDFQGNFTVAGNSTFNSSVQVNSTLNSTGNITSGTGVSAIDTLTACIRAGMESGPAAGGGSVFVRNNACLNTVTLDGLTGRISATGSIEVTNGGTVVASINPDGTVFANTRVTAPAAKLTASYVPNTACNAAQANDVAQNASSSGLVVCRGNLWIPIGLPTGTIGQPCPVNGSTGIQTDGVGIICQGNLWIAQVDRIGRFSVQDSFIGHHNDLVAKPGCPSDGVAKIDFTAIAGEFSPAVGIRSTYFLVDDLGANWRLRIVDAMNNAIPDGQGITKTGCWYN